MRGSGRFIKNMHILKLKNYTTKDTIAAIATFPAASALGVIKVSGKKALAVVSKIFKPYVKKDVRKVKTFTMHYGHIVNKGLRQGARGTAVIDEVLVSVMRMPHSYTTEDVVEISSHGGTCVMNAILKLLIKNGCRLALPGEFTYRALINGRIDMFQAQSVLDIVEAKSATALAVAQQQLAGKVSGQIDALKKDAQSIYSHLEALIHFEEQVDAPLAGIKLQVEKLAKGLACLHQASIEGKALREGLRMVICGRVNAGKSTLFNCLLRHERVIVSHIAGTTRDVVEETIMVKGVALRMYDTAGILKPRDVLDEKAIAKTRDAFALADVVVLVIDGSRRLCNDDLFLLKEIENKNAVVVINKSDCPQKVDSAGIRRYCSSVVSMAAVTGTGLEALEKALHSRVYRLGVHRQDAISLSTAQKQCLVKAAHAASKALENVRAGYTIDFIVSSIREVLDELGRISGDVMCEEILTDMFSNFCIGK